MKSAFVDIAKEQFKFLESDFGYVLISISKESFGGEIRYSSEAQQIGIKIGYEVTAGLVFITICRLIDGKFGRNELPVTTNSSINCIDFNGVLSDDIRMRPSYEYDESSSYFHPEFGLRNFVKEFAIRLQKYGQDLFRGDSEEFTKYEQIMRTKLASSF